MNLLKEIEKRLENLFEGFFRQQFRSDLQPVELAKKLLREMDQKRTISVSKIYVPNVFKVNLSPEDFHHLEKFQESLAKELGEYLSAHARQKRYTLGGKVRLEFLPSETLKLGEVKISSQLVEEEPSPLPRDVSKKVKGGTQVISPEEAGELGLLTRGEKPSLINLETGERYSLDKKIIFIGRLKSNDITLNDPSVSRQHASIQREGPGHLLTDLGSTNGTTVNNISVNQAFLEDEDCITIGRTTFVFRVGK